MRLKVKLPRYWAASNDGRPIYISLASNKSGALQISWAEYKGGELPNPTPQDLQNSAADFGKAQNLGELIENSSGPCVFGTFGTAVFRSAEIPRFQIWFLSNGRDFINAWHTCTSEPDPAEIADAQAIVRELTLGPDEPERLKKSNLTSRQKFRPGFRFSDFDLFPLVVGVVGSAYAMNIDRWLGIAIAFLILHFFLFCNVLRMSRPLELIWAGAFALMAILTISLHLFSWPAVLGVSLILTLILAIIETRRPSYHGLGWQKLNPRLPEWWQARQSSIAHEKQ
jgi:hypothetical protein